MNNCSMGWLVWGDGCAQATYSASYQIETSENHIENLLREEFYTAKIKKELLTAAKEMKTFIYAMEDREIKFTSEFDIPHRLKLAQNDVNKAIDNKDPIAFGDALEDIQEYLEIAASEEVEGMVLAQENLRTMLEEIYGIWEDED